MQHGICIPVQCNIHHIYATCSSMHNVVVDFRDVSHVVIIHRALDKREYLMIIFLISHRNHML